MNRRRGRGLSWCTWPLPWWSVIPYALFIGAFTAWTILGAREWFYIDTATASVLPTETVVLLGPLTAIVACLIGRMAWPRTSVAANPASSNAGWRLSGRVLATLAMWFAGSHLVAAATSLLWVTRTATWGQIQWVAALVPSTAALLLFTVIGLIVARVVDHWSSGLVAGAASVLVLAPAFGVLGLKSEISGWLMPGAALYILDPMTTEATFWVLGWWVAVLVAIVAWFVLVSDWRAREVRLRSSMAVVGATVFALTTGGLALAVDPPGTVAEVLEIRCTDSADVTYCVTIEEEPILQDLVQAGDQVFNRLGGAPSDITAVVTDESRSQFEKDKGAGGGTALSAQVSPGTGARYVSEDLATTLAGFPACVDMTDDTKNSAWTWALARWIAREDELKEIVGDGTGVEEWPETILLQADLSTVQAWYQENEEKFRACQYTGPGP